MKIKTCGVDFAIDENDEQVIILTLGPNDVFQLDTESAITLALTILGTVKRGREIVTKKQEPR